VTLAGVRWLRFIEFSLKTARDRIQNNRFSDFRFSHFFITGRLTRSTAPLITTAIARCRGFLPNKTKMANIYPMDKVLASGLNKSINDAG